VKPSRSSSPSEKIVGQGTIRDRIKRGGRTVAFAVAETALGAGLGTAVASGLLNKPAAGAIVGGVVSLADFVREQLKAKKRGGYKK
jgi:hypothetical protein